MNQTGLIFKNTAVLAAARMIDRAGSILLTFLVARVFQASGLGIYAAAMVVYELAAVAAEMGSTNLLVREVSKNPSNTNRYLVHLSLMSFAVSVFLLVALLVILPHLGYAPELVRAMYVVILAIIPGAQNVILEGVFVAHQRVEFVTFTTCISSIVNVSLSLYLLIQGYGIVSLLVAFVVIQYMITAIYFYLINHFISGIQFRFEFSYVRKLIGEIKTFTALSIVAALFSRPEVIILSLVSTEAQIGYYSAALKVITLWQYIPQIYMTNVFPVLSRSYYLVDKNVHLIQERSMKYLLAISLPLTAGIIVAAEPILELLYGVGFGPSAALLRLLALNIPLATLFAVLWRILVARNRQDLVLRAMILVTSTELVVGYILISAWASLGAAIITPSISLLYVFLLILYLKQDGTQIRLWRLSWRLGLAALGTGVLILPLSQQIQLWLLVPMAGVLYVILTILLKAFSADDIALLRNLWRP